MARKDCILELTPTRMRVIRLRSSGDPEIQSVPLSTDWERCWDKQLVPLQETLDSLLEGLSSRPARMHVVYLSPHAAADIVSFPKGPRVDQSALMLSAHDVLHVDSEAQPLAVQALVKDADSCDDPMQHILVSTDLDEHAEAVIGLVHSVDCHVGNIQPMHAYALRQTTPEGLGGDDSTVDVRVMIAEHMTSISVFDSERLLLVRTIDFGLRQIVGMIIRHLQDEEHDEESVRQDAWRMLFSVGIPHASEIVNEERAIMGRDILPMIQPVLQRIFVEIKQSLRFGVAREKLEHASISIIGPGANIPRLDELLADHLDINVSRSPSLRAEQISEDLERALSVVTTLGERRPRATLISTQRTRTLTLRNVRKGLVVGTLAASLLIVVNSAFQFLDATRAKERIVELRPQLSAVEEARFQFEQSDQLFAQLEQMRGELRARLDSRPSWSVFLHSLAESVPPSIQITEMRADSQGNTPSVRLEGVEYQSETRNAIQAFLSTLQESPLVDHVTLGGTHRTETERGDARQFTLTITLIPTDLEDWMADR
ncbi:MAG: PilN domain-containing protein [Phycisphaerales bacterium JB043]